MGKVRLGFVIVSCVLLLTACGDDDDNSSGKGVNAHAVPTGKPSGSFKKTGDVDPATLNTSYCSPDEVKLDPLLRIGQSMTQLKAEMNVDGTYGRQMFGPVQTIQVLELGKDSITRMYDVTVNGVQGWYKEACKFRLPEGGSHSECEVSEFSDSIKVLRGGASSTINTAWCYVQNTTPEESSFEEVVGDYTFVGGRKVKATFTKRTNKGDISCWDAKTSNFQVVGRGTFMEERIDSAEVPNIDAPTNCNWPTSIYYYAKAVLEDGTVKSHEQTEITRVAF